MMNKKNFIKYMSQTYNITNDDAKTIIDIFVDSVKSALKSQQEIKLYNFGSFKITNVKEKIMKKFNADDLYMVAAHKAPKFTFSKSIKKMFVK